MSMATRIVIALLVLANVASGVAVVFARHEHRHLFTELTKLERARDELNIEFGRLQLEQATWAETHRIEQIAQTQLGMKYPEPSELRVLTP